MIEFINVSKQYKDNILFKDFNLKFEENAVTCVLGVSGIGKTTLLKMIASLTDYSGEIKNKPEKVSFIFQEPRLVPFMTVKENLLFTMSENKESEYIKNEKIDKLLEKVGIFEKKDQIAKLLSGGEKQRVSVARAFLSDAKVMLLDEPFNSLDISLRIKMTNLLKKLLKETPKTVIYVTHGISEAACCADKIVVLKKQGVSIINTESDKFQRTENSDDTIEIIKNIYKEID